VDGGRRSFGARVPRTGFASETTRSVDFPFLAAKSLARILENGHQHAAQTRGSLPLGEREGERGIHLYTRGEIISATRGTPAAAAAAAAGKFLARTRHIEISRIISASLGGAFRGTRVLARPVKSDEGRGGEVTCSPMEEFDKRAERRTTKHKAGTKLHRAAPRQRLIAISASRNHRCIPLFTRFTPPPTARPPISMAWLDQRAPRHRLLPRNEYRG